MNAEQMMTDVQLSAARMWPRVHRWLDWDETRAAAMYGLAKAISTHQDGKGRTLRSWARKKMEGQIFDEMRAKIGRDPHTFRPILEELPGQVAEDTQPFEDRVVNFDLAVTILRRLGPRDRRILAARFLWGWSTEEIRVRFGFDSNQQVYNATCWALHNARIQESA